jgi:hemerythrin-like domain-containing protein
MIDERHDRVTPLKKEHAEIRHQLELVWTIMASSSNSRGRLRHAVNRLAALTETHFTEEETSLYEPLRSKMRSAGPVDSMGQEHRSILRDFRRLSASIRNQAQIRELRYSFILLETEIDKHIEREEKVLFWLAELKL